MPTFTFSVWLAGLAALVVALFLLAPLARGRGRFIRALAYPYGVIMLLNGAGHLLASVYFGRWMPGATTAPLLLACSIWLLWAAGRRLDAPDSAP
jgi:hypothetical protein